MLYVKIPPNATIKDKSFTSQNGENKGKTIPFFEARWSQGPDGFIIQSTEKIEVGSEGFVRIKDFQKFGKGFTLVSCRMEILS